MRDVAALLNDMRAAGVITNYALIGAVAQMRYTEPVAVPASDRLDVLSSIYQFCAERGYLVEGEALRVGAWPVQFIPVFSSLTREAME